MSKRARALKALARPRLAEAWDQQMKERAQNAPGRGSRRTVSSASPSSNAGRAPGAPSVMVRWGTGMETYSPAELGTLAIERALPFRTPLHHNGAISSTGLLPMTKTEDVLATESRAERAVAMEIDFCGGYSGISSQPCQIAFADGRRHVPDFAVRHANGVLTIVDVRPTDRQNEKSNEVFALTSEVLAISGVQHVVHGGLSERHDMNLRFLAAFGRRPRFWAQCSPTLRGMAEHGQSVRWGELRDQLSDQFALSFCWTQPVVGHAVWTGLLAVDLDQPLHDRTALQWTPGREQGTVR